MATLNLQVAASTDDAKQLSDGSSDVTAVRYRLSGSGTPGEHLGLRFAGVGEAGAGIPQGATITSALLALKFDNQAQDNINGPVSGEKATNSSTFTTTANDLSDRTKTTASVTWNEQDIAAAGVPAFYDSPELITVLQELVDQVGWDESSPVTIFVERPAGGGGDFGVLTFDNDPGDAAKLTVEYTAAGGGERDRRKLNLLGLVAS
ncbi:MAG: hypothetical protein GEU71_03695 [Actinobacteria bacterium]|nr:hypothetical protein [Actinomycetota bacterium]